MDFVLDNIYWLVIVAAGLVQWWKATQEAKAERQREAEEYNPADMGEMPGRNSPRPAIPPPLPQAAPAPALRRSAPEPPPFETNPYGTLPGELERQTQLAEQIKLLKRAKRQRSPEETPTVTSRRRNPVESSGTLRGRLGNRRELRQAFILKEVLEKPLGLR